MGSIRHRATAAAIAWLALGAPVEATAAARFTDRAPAAPGGRLAVALERGSVRIVSHDRPEVRVEADVRGLGASSVHFRLERESAGLRLRVETDEWLRFLSGGPSVRVRIRVPRAYSVDVATVGGPIEVIALRGDVVARSRGGEIHVANVEGRVDLVTSNGRIQITAIRGRLRARSVGGWIAISDVRGPVEAATGDGQIRIGGVIGAVDARSRGGPIALSLPARARADVDARTRSGRIHVEPGVALRGDVGPRHARGAINGGGDPLLLRSAAGHITLRAN